MIFDTDAIDFGISTLRGDLEVTANNGGDITQSGRLAVTGASTFTVDGGQDIVLGNDGNNLVGAVNFEAATGQLNNVTIANTNDINLQTLDINGNLTVLSSIGNIRQESACKPER